MSWRESSDRFKKITDAVVGLCRECKAWHPVLTDADRNFVLSVHALFQQRCPGSGTIPAMTDTRPRPT